MKKTLFTIALTSLLGAAPELLVPALAAESAPAAEQAAPAVAQSAEFVDANGNVVLALTTSDGTLFAFVNGALAASGNEAFALFADRGISLSVSPTGEITAYGVEGQASLKSAPSAADPDSAQAAAALAGLQQAPATAASVMPANIAPGSGFDEAAYSAQHEYADSINKGPVSR